MNGIAQTNEQSRSVLIIGLGLTGISCARFLVNKGFAVTIIDTREQPPSLATVQKSLPTVVIKTGHLETDLLLKADMIVLSPGIDPRITEIVNAREAGIEIVGDIELFARYALAPIIAITGSNGKSTVTTMLADLAIKSGKQVEVGGNLGIPALDLLNAPVPDFYILELSSFQLETVRSLNAYASVVLNVSPDHMDRYNTIDEYQDTKAKIYNGNGVKIINRDDPFVANLPSANADAEYVGFTLTAPTGNDFGVIDHQGQQWLTHGQQPLLPTQKLSVTGKHNIANALAALALGSVMNLSMTMMLTAIQAYRGLPHRCYLVTESAGVRWFNDSKATNVGACIAAIEGLSTEGRLIVIAGGEGKNQDFSALTQVFERYVFAVVLLGKDAESIAKHMPVSVTALFASDMADAVSKAHNLTQQGDCVLLSPACASFDMFTGYADRGDTFMHAVKERVA